MKMRVAEYIAEYLEGLQCEAVFLLSGGGMMHLLDAVSRRKHLKYFCNHHEQASAMAAESYARVSGKLGVCYATSGPGGTNTITGVAGAWLDSSPVLFVSGQSKVLQTIEGTGRAALRQCGTFEVNIVPVVQSITKYAAFVATPESIRFHLEKACFLSTNGRPGPVFLDVPVDIQGALIDPKALPSYFDASGSPPPEDLPKLPKLEPSVVAEILARLGEAKRPLILAGHGVRCAHAAGPFAAMVTLLNIPVVTTQLAVDLLPHDHPLFVGHPGMKGDRPGNFAVQTADVILSLGSSLHVTTTGYELDKFAPHAYKIQVDSDLAVLARESVGVAQKVHADLGEFISSLTENLRSQVASQRVFFKDSPWHQRCSGWKETLSVFNEPHQSSEDKPNYYDVIRAIGEASAPDAVITSDSGSAFYVVGQALRTKPKQRVIVSGGLGTMGFALPAATGAAVARPNAEVICFTGDGSLQTNLHELAVIRHNSLNIKIIVINNDGYVSIRNTQNNFFEGHLAGTSRSSGVSFPKLEKMAEGFGIHYVKIDAKAHVDETLRAIFRRKGPAIVEVFGPSNQEILPTVSSVRLEDGSMRSKPIHDMYPFMSESVLAAHLATE